MSERYTRGDVRRGIRALVRATDWEPFWDKRVEALLDAVVPSLIARVLREAGDELWLAALDAEGSPADFARAKDWLHARADEIGEASA